MKKKKHKKHKKGHNVVIERWKWMYNEVEHGTQSERIIENSFVRRAENKLNLWNVWGRVFFIFLLPFILAITLLICSSLNIKGNLLVFIHISIGAVIVLGYRRFIFKRVWNKLIDKYWTCPNCGKPLPWEEAGIYYKGRPGIIHVLPNVSNPSCPYCNMAFLNNPNYTEKNNKNLLICLIICFICLFACVLITLFKGIMNVIYDPFLYILLSIVICTAIYRIIWQMRH